MIFVLYTNIVSPHQMALAKRLSRVQCIEFYYIYTEKLPKDAAKRGWSWGRDERWMLYSSDHKERVECLLTSCDVLLSGIRLIDVFEKRIAKGRKTLYMSERWFKPVYGLPGWLRLCILPYFRMVRRFSRLFKSQSFYYLPMGPWASFDMMRACRVTGIGNVDNRMIPWGYYVEPSAWERREWHAHVPLRILWVGRMLRYKRVDTIVRAVSRLRGAQLTLVGQGEKREDLISLAKGMPVSFLDPVPISHVRTLMRENDVYVLSSDENEGWGAVLNEAMEEGMLCIGTFEAGASAAMLPETHKYHAGDWRSLASLLMQVLEGHLKPVGIGEWTVERAMGKIMQIVGR